MPDFNALLAQAAGSVPAPTIPTMSDLSPKQASVADAAARKKDMLNAAAGRGNNLGMASAAEREIDLRTLNPSQMIEKYGPQAGSLIQESADAGSALSNVERMQRTNGQAIQDNALGVASGLINSVGGIGALGAGLVNENAGAAVTNALTNFNTAVQSAESPTLRANRDMNQVTGELRTRDNTAQFEKDKTTDGNLVANLKRIGRDTIDSVQNAATNGMVMQSGIAQGMGSMLAAGPVSKVITGGAALGGKAAGAIAEKLAVPAAIGLMEGGGVYQQTSAEIAKMPFDKLFQSSPEFVSLVQEGMSPEAARTTLQNRAGLTAAAIQAPIGAATGMLVSKFEGNPLARNSLTTSLANLGRETLEEGIQSGTGQVAQNYALQRADKDKVLSEGVGEQIGQGALYGLGSAGVIQAPSVGVQATVDAVKALKPLKAELTTLAGQIKEGVSNLGSKIQADNAAASPVATETVREAFATANAAAPEAAAQAKQSIAEMPESTPEVQAGLSAYVDELISTGSADLGDMSATPQFLRDMTEGATDKVDLIQRFVAKMESDSPADEKLLSGQILNMFLSEISDVLTKAPAGIETLPEDSDAVKLINSYQTMLASVQQTPAVQAALKAVEKVASTAKADGLLQPVTEDVESPAAVQNIKNHIAVAEMSPKSADLDGVVQILQQANAGKIQLPDGQRRALETVAALLQGARAYDTEAEAMGLAPTDIVGKQIKTDDSAAEGQYSALQHAQLVRQAYRTGDLNTAAFRLEDFMKFVQHMSNKVGAFNANLRGQDLDPSGNTLYSALSPDTREFQVSRNGLKIHPRNENSVRLAQTIALEAKTLAGIANGLADAFPELNVKHIEPVSLDGLLVGSASQVATEFKNGTRNVRTKPEANTKQSVDIQPSQPTDVTQEIVGQDPTEVESSQSVEKVEAIADTPEPKTVVAEKADEKVTEPSTTTEVVPEPTKQEATPVVDQKSAEVSDKPASDPLVEDKVETPAATGMAAVYPNVVRQVRNMFEESFKLPKQPKSRLTGSGDPMPAVLTALKSDTDYRSFTGELPKNRLTPEVKKAYSDLLSFAPKVMDSLQKQLDEFLNKKNKTGLSVADGFKKGMEANRWVTGKTLNITEPKGDGFVYNPELVQSATLAAFQWLIAARDTDNNIDETDAAAVFGIPLDYVTADHVNLLKTGQTLSEVLSGLAQKIESFWGFDTNRSAPEGYTKGIPRAMAAEMLRAMLDTGLMDQRSFAVDDVGRFTENSDTGATAGAGPKVKDLYLFTGSEMSEAIRTFPDAIERAVLMEPEAINYIGEPVPKIADTQMRNPYVQNTPEARAAIDANQKVSHYIDTSMADLYSAMGESAILELFGNGDFDPDNFNDQHLLTLDGQNRTIQAAYQHMMGVISQVKDRAAVAGVAADQMPIHYAHNMSLVGRLQMLGKYNPQSSKLVREAILPTRSTLDLSSETSSEFAAYRLGLAQALGVKIHNMSEEASSAKLKTVLGNVVEVRDILSAWLKSGGALSPSSAQTVINILKAQKLNSPVALHALTDYARWENASTAERKAFTTSIYVEADGVTNGPVNAMQLLSAGAFTPEWVTNMAKGGLFIGEPNKTMNEHRTSGDTRDMYQTTTDHLSSALRSLRGQYKGTEVGTQIRQLNTLMNLFLDDFDIKDGKLELQRGIAKNPLTITIYGSGAAGIANKVTTALMDEIYVKMSDVIQKMGDGQMTEAEAMFGPGPLGQEKFDKFQAAFSALTETTVRSSKEKGLYLVEAERGRPTNLSPKKFKFSIQEKAALTDNVRHLFVTPLVQSITNTVGESMLDSAKMLRQATQIQSIYLKYAFKDAVNKALMEKAKDKTWKKSDFLSSSELASLFASIKNLAPLVQTPTQDFFIAVSSAADIESSVVSRAFNEQFESPAQVYGPDNSGVRGIPALVIGTGDGQMIQTVSTNGSGADRKLMVFDGIHLPLDNIRDGSREANEAVFKSWMGNPMMAVSKSFNTMLEKVNKEIVSKEMLKELAEAAFNPGVDMDGVTAETVNNQIQQIQSLVESAAIDIDARHNVMKGLTMSIDQMASASSPYQHTGTTIAGTPEEKADQLNALYKVERERLRVEKRANKTEDKIDAQLEKVGRVHKSGAREISFTALKNLNKTLKITPQQKSLLGEVIRSLGSKEYKIVHGTAEQIAAYADAKSKTVLSAEKVTSTDTQGYIVPGERMIYLINPSVETLVHELVHATTLETIQAHYAGTLTGSNAAQVKEAVRRIDLLMTQFLSMDAQVQPLNADIQRTYENTRAVIQQYLAQNDMPSALNEFMAWGLSNRALGDLLRNNEAHPLVKLAQSVYDAIVALVWGKKIVPSLNKSDMFNNLQFNTGVIMRLQPSLSLRVADGIRFQNSAYGNNDRLVELNKTFAKKIADNLSESRDPFDQSARQTVVTDAQMVGTQATVDMAKAGFNMSMQERSTYNMVVAALATEARIDPNALVKAQELWTHVSKNLKVDDFMVDPNSLHPADRYYAQQKFDAVLGVGITQIDKQGRSTLLSSFLALAMTNEEFRKILYKMDLPKTKLAEWNTLDGALENVGLKMIDSLETRFAGTNQTSNVRDAIDGLSAKIYEVAQDRQMFIDQYASKVGGVIDRANDIVVEGIETLSNKVMDVAQDVQDNSTNKVVKGLAGFTKLVAGIATEENGTRVAEGLMVGMNKMKAWKPFFDVVNDIVGRTTSNADIYDSIKRVRAFVQQLRQQYRESVPTIIASKFTRQLEDAEWTTLFNTMGKTDLAGLIATGMPMNKVMSLLSDKPARAAEIARLESEIKTSEGPNARLILNKSQQLADFMMTGKPGVNLLRNAYAVGSLFGENAPRSGKPSSALVRNIDQLVSIYAMEQQSPADAITLSSLVRTEGVGMEFAASYLVGQRVDEMRKADANENARTNQYKGHIPSTQAAGLSLIVADDSEYASLRERSYERVGSYVGSSLDPSRAKKGYYFSPVSSRAYFNQGILQNVRHTAGNVDVRTGFTMSPVAGRITDPVDVRRIAQQLGREKGNENLMPVYNKNGKVIAFEQSIDPVQAERLQHDTHLAKMIGVWRGRQAEEETGQIFNRQLIDRLHAMYQEDLKSPVQARNQYVNLFDPKTYGDDTPTYDAVSLMTQSTRTQVENLFGKDTFMVRKDMLNDALGYRSASVGDAWTGNSRWSPKTQLAVKNLAMSAFGNDAFKHLLNTERVIQNFVSDARVLIVVKSVVVPVANVASNIYQLVSRGVPLGNIVRSMPKKTIEIDSYVKTKLRAIDAEAELRAAAGDIVAERRLKAEILSIEDSHKRLSIWPLIEAGEFSSISDAGISRDEILLSEGRLHAYMERMVDKLPAGVQTFGRYALVTKDTALFQGLQKAVEYGDFLAKAVLYDDLTIRQKKSKEQALGRVTEEYVNYDRLPGRFRGYLESMGLLWFYNFKIRSTKVALSMIRNNPVHAMIGGLAPAPNGIGTPLGDNLLSKGLSGVLPESIGFGMAFRAPALNPWANLIF